MISPEVQKEIESFIIEDAPHVMYGKLIIEVTVIAGQATNVQCETKKSKNIDKRKQYD